MAVTHESRFDHGDRRYIASAMDAPLLERDQEIRLAKLWLEKREVSALHSLVGAHARLVVRIATGFRASRLPLADLIQEGNIGLMQAAERFDPTREVRFSTYASWWIVSSIQNFILRNFSIVRIATTAKQRQLFFGVRRRLGRAGLGCNGGFSTDERLGLAKQHDVTLADVERMEVHVRPDQSLNAAIGNDESAEIQDFLADAAPTPEEIVEDDSGRRARSDWIKQALGRLTPRERKIVERRFLGESGEKLADIGNSYGISKERVRQIEERALLKMKETLLQLADRPEDIVGS